MYRRIVQLRNERGITRQEFADSVGISLSYARKIEKGEKIPSVYTLLDIARYYGVTLDYIACGENERMVDT